MKSEVLGLPLAKVLERRIKTMTMKLDFPNMVEVLSDPKKCETFSCKPREMKVKFC